MVWQEKRRPKIRMFSDNFKEVGLIEFSLEDLTYSDSDDWANYPKGVLNYLIESGHNIDSGIDVLFYGTIPNGAGLSSSASIELLMGTICNDLYALHCPMLELVQIGKKWRMNLLALIQELWTNLP